MLVAVIDNTSTSTTYLDKLVDFLKTVANVRVVRDLRDFRRLPAGVSAFILSGSTTHIPDMSPATHALNEAAIRSGRPVLGICFGAQFICTYFGGRIRRMSRFLCDSRLVRRGAAAEPFKARFCARYCLARIPAHICEPTYTVVGALDGQNAAVVGFRHRTLPIDATLFHPEYDPGTHHIIADWLQQAHRSKTK